MGRGEVRHEHGSIRNVAGLEKAESQKRRPALLDAKNSDIGAQATSDKQKRQESESDKNEKQKRKGHSRLSGPEIPRFLEHYLWIIIHYSLFIIAYDSADSLLLLIQFM